MYTPQLKAFFAVAESGSFSKAAAALYLTPSAVLNQIRTLEKELGVELFHRTARGVTMTPAGAYLEQHGRAFMQMGDSLRRDISAIASQENTICIATSMLEKCRLLYELWVLFSAEHPEYSVQMVSIDHEHNIPSSTDLIESPNSQVPWMQEWEFLEICKVPFGFGVVHDHPLAKKERITLEDLRGETVYTINNGSCEAVSSLLSLLKKNGIQVVFKFNPGMEMFWEPAFTRGIQLFPLCFQDILINMTVVPFEQEFLLPYGIFYRSNPTPPVRSFLDFIRSTYENGNISGIVPVLQLR